MKKSPNFNNWSGFAISDEQSVKEKKLLRQMLTTVVEYNLIEQDDHILVAISGGKDSYGLLDLLLKSQKRAPIDFKITAVHLDQKQPGYDGNPLRDWLVNNRIEHKIIEEDTYSIVKDKIKEGDTYCSLCSRLRRGILYRIAKEIGANKIALGHHRDDSLETLLLNLIYQGKLQAMPAKYMTDDQSLYVIRPLIEIAENDLSSYAKRKEFPILPCNLCGSQEGLKRQKIKEMLSSWEIEKPDIKSVMLNALKNVRVSHLLDHQFLDSKKAIKKRLRVV